MQSNLKSIYQNYIQTNKLKSSKRRDIIFDHVLKTSGHFTIDSIYHHISQHEPEIGIATVYRTIRMLVDCGILLEHTFGEKKSYFEVNLDLSRHHDHLICYNCGKIIEIDSDFINDHKESISKQHHFKITSHKLEIYGLCSKCQVRKHEETSKV